NNLAATELQFNTWNHTTGAWSAPTVFLPGSGASTETKAITLTSNPYSDQIMLMVNNNNKNVFSDLWSGTAFAAPITMTRPATAPAVTSGVTPGVPMSFFWDSFLVGTVTTQTTFTQTAPMVSPFVMPVGGAVTVTTYIQVTSGALPATPKLSVSLA